MKNLSKEIALKLIETNCDEVWLGTDVSSEEIAVNDEIEVRVVKKHTLTTDLKSFGDGMKDVALICDKHFHSEFETDTVQDLREQFGIGDFDVDESDEEESDFEEVIK